MYQLNPSFWTGQTWHALWQRSPCVESSTFESLNPSKEKNIAVILIYDSCMFNLQLLGQNNSLRPHTIARWITPGHMPLWDDHLYLVRKLIFAVQFHQERALHNYAYCGLHQIGDDGYGCIVAKNASNTHCFGGNATGWVLISWEDWQEYATKDSAAPTR